MEELRPGDPRQVGGYRPIGRIGAGGMGQVFLGRSPGGRPVAVMLIRQDLAQDPAFRARFAREAAAARRVSGMSTAPVVDAGRTRTGPGSSPPTWTARPWPTRWRLGAAGRRGVTGLAAALAEGLAAVHRAGVVHRDLKPSNVLLAADGPRIIDVGISRAAEAGSLTSAGEVIGSPRLRPAALASRPRPAPPPPGPLPRRPARSPAARPAPPPPGPPARHRS